MGHTGVVSHAGRKPETRIRGLPPIARHDARILVLGSMPGVASLQAREYYAHPRNQFWTMLGDIAGLDRALPYAQRVAALMDAGIAVWDVVASCRRRGSLDSAIDGSSIVVNPFAKFLASHRRIARVCFNGRKAEATWRRHVLRRLPQGRELEYRPLPSTSPANAGMSYRRKLGLWRNALQC